MKISFGYTLCLLGALLALVSAAPIPNDGGWVLQQGDNQMSEDLIGFTVNYVGGSQAKLTLVSRVTWWKALVSGNWELAATQDSRSYSSTAADKDYLNGLSIYLSKAKTFGVHTNMYLVKNKFENGYEYVFEWKKD